jgi:adenylate cyclase
MTESRLNPELSVAQRSIPRLQELLDIAVQDPSRQAEVVEKVDEEFGQLRAILVADLDSFTASTVEHGITAFLVVLRQVHLLVNPIVRRYGGLELRSQADTLFCLFDTVDDALSAAADIRRKLRETDLHLHGGHPVTIAMGIGYGRLLNIADEDALGSAVNFAYKLGEDVGEGGDILLTEEAWALVRNPEHEFETRETRVSGLSLTYYALR